MTSKQEAFEKWATRHKVNTMRVIVGDSYLTDSAYIAYEAWKAVIEEYKASLVPVGYMYQHDETGRTTFRGLEERMVERRWFEIPLYALGETK